MKIKIVKKLLNSHKNLNSYKNCEEIFKSFATFLVKDINACIENGNFPDELKTTDITSAFKKVKNTTNQTTD